LAGPLDAGKGMSHADNVQRKVCLPPQYILHCDDASNINRCDTIVAKRLLS
jgi:hypothetical protein